MKRLLLTLAACASMQAATIGLANGDAQNQDSQTTRTWSILGGTVTMTVTGWMNTGTPYNNAGNWTQIKTTQFGSNSIGLGVCDDVANNGISDDCSFNEWQVDNNNGDNFLLFTFSAPVDITGFTYVQTTLNNVDGDITWGFLAGVAGNPSAVALTGSYDMPGTTGFDSGESRTQPLAGSSVRSFLVGTPTGADDYWKAFSIEVSTPPTINNVPEPGSMALLGSGLVGLGFIARRRRK